MAGIHMSMDGIPKLERELQRLNSVRFDAVEKKNAKEMFSRSKGTNSAQGGTPVAQNTKWHKGGQMRNTIEYLPEADGIGYTVEYAPHVEYGHRTIDGGYVPGQHFLQNNVDIQRPIYREDLLKAIRKG